MSAHVEKPAASGTDRREGAGGSLGSKHPLAGQTNENRGVQPGKR